MKLNINITIFFEIFLCKVSSYQGKSIPPDVVLGTVYYGFHPMVVKVKHRNLPISNRGRKGGEIDQAVVAKHLLEN